ncbi:MAG: hypothetical protein GHCLOJNM_00258 [bacterium]|nr:hypothetical protein [bacterium]
MHRLKDSEALTALLEVKAEAAKELEGLPLEEAIRVRISSSIESAKQVGLPKRKTGRFGENGKHSDLAP